MNGLLDNDKECFLGYTSPIIKNVEPVGKDFLKKFFAFQDDKHSLQFENTEKEESVSNVDDDIGNEYQSDSLLNHDPINWRSADLYAVLGISKLRYKATIEQINIAHKKQIMKHHPDKKTATGKKNDDSFFKIIQLAYDVLTNPIERLKYDSVDVKAHYVLPPLKSDYDFFEVWKGFFEYESIFSKNNKIPQLGDINSSEEDVNLFYKFWVNFDSEKVFDFLDEEIPDDSSNRANKRYIERKNNANRKKLKQQEINRLINLVNRAYSEDPRIKKFKDMKKKKREKKKINLEQTVNIDLEAENKKLQLEQDALVEKEKNKKLKEAAKNAKKKAKRNIRAKVKDLNYFDNPSQAEKVDSELNLILEKLNQIDLQNLSNTINDSTTNNIQMEINFYIKKLLDSNQVSSSDLSFFTSFS